MTPSQLPVGMRAQQIIAAFYRAGYPIERGLEACLVEPNDIVLSPSVKGDKEAMRRYLEWEIKLTQ